MNAPVPRESEAIARPSTASRRREQIVEKAVRLFAEHGYAGTDTQLLADQLKVGKGTLYRYFSSKEELFLAATDYVMRKLSEHVLSYVEETCDPFQQIERGVRAYLVFFAEHPEFVELLIQEARLVQGPATTDLLSASGAERRALAGTLSLADRRRSSPRHVGGADQ